MAVALLAEMSDMRLPPVSASHMAEASFERKRDRPTEALKTVRLTSEPLMLEFSLVNQMVLPWFVMSSSVFALKVTKTGMLRFEAVLQHYAGMLHSCS